MLLPRLLLNRRSRGLVSDLSYGRVLYASIVGNVTDPSKASVPGAPPSGFGNQATAASTKSPTSEQGGFLLSNVQSDAWERSDKRGKVSTLKSLESGEFYRRYSYVKFSSEQITAFV